MPGYSYVGMLSRSPKYAAGIILASGVALILLPRLARYAGYISGATENAYRKRIIKELEKEMNKSYVPD